MSTHMPLATYSIIALTAIVTIIGFSNKHIFEKSFFSVGAILHDKEIYRLVTSQLFHANWAHLLFNMISFYSFGSIIEERFGPALLIAIYVTSALSGDIVALIIKRKNPAYAAVGASGAVCGIIFASIFLFPGGSIYILPLPVPLPSWLYAVLFMIVSLYGIGRGGSIIGHEAHIGGALAGIVWAVVYSPSIIYQNWLLVVGLTVPVIVLLIFFINKAKSV